MSTAKKELELVRQPDGRMYRLKFKGGGQLPAELTGEYTSISAAEKDMAAYLFKRDNTKNGSSKKATGTK